MAGDGKTRIMICRRHWNMADPWLRKRYKHARHRLNVETRRLQRGKPTYRNPVAERRAMVAMCNEESSTFLACVMDARMKVAMRAE